MAISRQDRAKQFLPFDALKGLKEAMKQKELELEHEDRKELSEESFNQLQEELNKLDIDDVVGIRYYRDRKYIEILGRITKIDNIKKKIQIDKKENINFSDIIKIFVK